MCVRAVWLPLAAAAWTAGAAPATAHHGWSGYDASQLVTLAGTVQSITYAAPHVILTLEADGKLWEVVLAPPSRMSRRGLPDGRIEAGGPATVQGYQHRSDPDEFRAERISLEGESFELR
jgi:hypothetical protein